MTYNAKTFVFEIREEAMRRAADSFILAMRNVREIAGLPLDRYEQKGALSTADHAQRSIIEAAKCFGINLGSDWGHEIDLRPR